MKTITQSCQTCKENFEAQLREVNRGNGKYCSKVCSNEGVKKKLLERSALINIPNVECSYCKKMFYKNNSKKQNSRSNFHFCCREHKDLAQRIEFGLKKIQPSHYGEIMTDYRELAKRYKKLICERCQYDKYPEILEVHHRDRNRKNNTIENLEILCPRCHCEEHFLNKDGKWKIKTATPEEIAV